LLHDGIANRSLPAVRWHIRPHLRDRPRPVDVPVTVGARVVEQDAAARRVPDPPGQRTLPSTMFPPDFVRRARTITTLDNCVRSVLCSAFRCALTPDQLVAEDGQVTAANAVPATPSANAATAITASFLMSPIPLSSRPDTTSRKSVGGSSCARGLPPSGWG
jgi:hypothetical protein